MSRYLTIAVAFALAAGCGNKSDEQEEPEVPPVAPTATKPSKVEPPPAKSADKLLGVGDTAPDFTMEAHNGQTITLSQLDGPVVLYFYPRDETPG
jgi:hypothetical protein